MRLKYGFADLSHLTRDELADEAERTLRLLHGVKPLIPDDRAE